MHLEDRCRIAGGDRALNSLADGIGFVCPECEKENFPGFHNGSNAHGDHMMGHLGLGAKEWRIVPSCALRQRLNAGARGE